MKKIDLKYPMLAQLEDGDAVICFDAFNLEKPFIGTMPIKWRGDTLCEANTSEPSNRSFSLTKSEQLKSYYICSSGFGFATTFDAACEAISSFLCEKIEKLTKENESLEKTISLNTKQIEKMQNSKNKLINMNEETICQSPTLDDILETWRW